MEAMAYMKRDMGTAKIERYVAIDRIDILISTT